MFMWDGFEGGVGDAGADPVEPGPLVCVPRGGEGRAGELLGV